MNGDETDLFTDEEIQRLHQSIRSLSVSPERLEIPTTGRNPPNRARVRRARYLPGYAIESPATMERFIPISSSTPARETPDDVNEVLATPESPTVPNRPPPIRRERTARYVSDNGEIPVATARSVTIRPPIPHRATSGAVARSTTKRPSTIRRVRRARYPPDYTNASSAATARDVPIRPPTPYRATSGDDTARLAAPAARGTTKRPSTIRRVSRARYLPDYANGSSAVTARSIPIRLPTPARVRYDPDLAHAISDTSDGSPRTSTRIISKIPGAPGRPKRVRYQPDDVHVSDADISDLSCEFLATDGIYVVLEISRPSQEPHFHGSYVELKIIQV